MSNLFRRAFLGLLLVTACGVAPARVFASPPTPNPDPDRFEPEIAAFEKWDAKNSFPRDAVLFVGSSSIRLWNTAEAFPEYPVINRGFGGSHISDVNHFAERIVFKYKPRVIVFYAGDNDIAAGKSHEQVVADFKQFVRMTHERLPRTPICFISIKPSIAREKLWPQMDKANRAISVLSRDDSSMIFIDVAARMLGEANDKPPRELFQADGLHLNAAGYKLWNKVLRLRLAERH